MYFVFYYIEAKNSDTFIFYVWYQITLFLHTHTHTHTTHTCIYGK